MPDALIARIGGDEFLVVYPRALDAEAIESERLRMREKLNHAFLQDEQLKNVSASIGTAFSPAGEPTDLDPLLEEADNMMYQEKKQKKGRTSRRR
jgi:diguanylate cyclase (GGDEF)-like protein